MPYKKIPLFFRVSTFLQIFVPSRQLFFNWNSINLKAIFGCGKENVNLVLRNIQGVGFFSRRCGQFMFVYQASSRGNEESCYTGSSHKEATVVACDNVGTICSPLSFALHDFHPFDVLRPILIKQPKKSLIIYWEWTSLFHLIFFSFLFLFFFTKTPHLFLKVFFILFSINHFLIQFWF